MSKQGSIHSVTVRLVLRTWPKRTDNTYPVTICVTHRRRRRYYGQRYGLAVHLTPDEFERVTSRRATGERKRLQEQLNSAVLAVQDALRQIPPFQFTFQELERLAFQNRPTQIGAPLVSAILQSYARQAKATATRELYQNTAQHLDSFDKRLTLAALTPRTLERLELALRRSGLSDSSIGIDMRNLRTIYNQAIREGRADRRNYPFGRGRYVIPDGGRTPKITDLNTLRTLLLLEADNADLQFARDLYVLSLFTGGANPRDLLLLRTESILHDRLIFGRAKTTGQTGAEIPLTDTHRTILERYAGSNTPYLLPGLKKGLTEKALTYRVRRIRKNANAALRAAGIATTLHRARNSFSTYMSSVGASEALIGEMMGHSSNSVTRGYMAFPLAEKRRFLDALREYVISEGKL